MAGPRFAREYSSQLTLVFVGCWVVQGLGFRDRGGPPLCPALLGPYRGDLAPSRSKVTWDNFRVGRLGDIIYCVFRSGRGPGENRRPGPGETAPGASGDQGKPRKLAKPYKLYVVFMAARRPPRFAPALEPNHYKRAPKMGSKTDPGTVRHRSEILSWYIGDIPEELM
jgi:hypothetical protein